MRFRSEYDYALFEYYRSAKVIAYLEQAGVSMAGRILDAGCGGGGMPVSFAEEAQSLTAIDLTPRFRDAGTRLAAERGVRNVSFAVANGMSLPFRDRVVRPRAVARRDRARGRRGPLPARVPAAC